MYTIPDSVSGLPREQGFWMPAEWFPREATLMSWPVREEAWLAGLEEAREGYVEVARAIAEFEPLIMVARPLEESNRYRASEDARRRLPASVEIWEFPHDDSWMRDNGPTILVDVQGRRAGVNWKFNAWGEKYHPYEADDQLAPHILARLGLPRFDAPLVLEGGSIHVDGEGTLLTTEECLLAPNRNPRLSRADIEQYLRDYLGVDTIIWLGKGLWGDETDGHVDNLACFVRPGLVVLQGATGQDSPNWERTQENLRILSEARDARGRRLEVVLIPEPPQRFYNGEPLTLSYINFYPVTGGLVVPVFGKSGDGELKKTDDRALGILRDLYPDRILVPIDGMKIIKGGGNVHCITQQIPAARRTENSEA
ncbi:agmatine deiminase family protein [Treponema sp. J25]|uniref:agmatine deiminase family protein n=1 Tax=Treponema sp. J25 TaxID=2094121 RepID=UPI001046F4DB|nr:agmatine deiminase family protein [Treponema sp. J25]TCW62258.1 agmatine deiminase [Treponema sp. J25]